MRLLKSGGHTLIGGAKKISQCFQNKWIQSILKFLLDWKFGLVSFLVFVIKRRDSIGGLEWMRGNINKKERTYGAIRLAQVLDGAQV